MSDNKENTNKWSWIPESISPVITRRQALILNLEKVVTNLAKNVDNFDVLLNKGIIKSHKEKDKKGREKYEEVKIMIGGDEEN